MGSIQVSILRLKNAVCSWELVQIIAEIHPIKKDSEAEYEYGPSKMEAVASQSNKLLGFIELHHLLI